MARPRIELTTEQLEQLANLSALMATEEEMAAEMKLHADTLRDRFSTVIKDGQNKGRLSLRRAQFAAALGRQARPAIYLRASQGDDGRQYGDLVLDEKGKPILLQPYIEPVKANATMQIWLGKNWLNQSDRILFGGGDGFEFGKPRE